MDPPSVAALETRPITPCPALTITPFTPLASVRAQPAKKTSDYHVASQVIFLEGEKALNESHEHS